MNAIPVLLNTKAGAMHAGAGQEQLRRMAQDVGVALTIVHTQSADEFRRRLKELIAAGTERLAVAGGDGTVELAVQELAHTQTALGILSQGTFNNFATTLRLPHNLPAALRTLKDGQIRHVDLGKIGDRYFTESAGVGLFADALAFYGNGTNKNFVRGLCSFARQALTAHAHNATLCLDGTEVPLQLTLCEVANTYRIAQAIPIAPEADIADGLLDIVVMTDLRRRELLAYLRALRAQMHLGLPKIRMFQAREIRIEAPRPLNVHADDTVIGKTPVTITIQPNALRVLVDERL